MSEISLIRTGILTCCVDLNSDTMYVSIPTYLIENNEVKIKNPIIKGLPTTLSLDTLLMDWLEHETVHMVVKSLTTKSISRALDEFPSFEKSRITDWLTVKL